LLSEREYVELNGCDLFRDGELVFLHKSTELPEYVALLHKHDFIEITYIISGECRHISNQSECILKKGDLIIVDSDTPHMNIPLDESFVAYDCIFTPDFIDAGLIGCRYFNDLNSSFIFRSMFPESTGTAPDLHVIGSNGLEFDELFKKMHSEYVSMNKGYIEIIRAYLIELFIKIFRELDRSRKEEEQPADITANINAVIKYLKDNYNTEIKLEEAALNSFLSKSYFSRLFRKVTGNSFTQYLHQLRIEEACKLLESTDIPITDISLKIGFNDVKFFYTIFKRTMQMTPGEYRKKFR